MKEAENRTAIDRFTTAKSLYFSSLRHHSTHPCQNPLRNCQGELVDFSGDLTYPRAGPKSNPYEELKVTYVLSIEHAPHASGSHPVWPRRPGDGVLIMRTPSA